MYISLGTYIVSVLAACVISYVAGAITWRNNR